MLGIVGITNWGGVRPRGFDPKEAPMTPHHSPLTGLAAAVQSALPPYDFLPDLALPSAPTRANAPQSAPNDAIARQSAPPTAPAQDELPPTARQSAPQRPAVAENENCETNPPPTPNRKSQIGNRNSKPRPLTPNQLRAASLLVAGHSTTAIAAYLNVDRHTLTRWKRHPLFVQELRALIGSSGA
jgi:hypothetical protein